MATKSRIDPHADTPFSPYDLTHEEVMHLYGELTDYSMLLDLLRRAFDAGLDAGADR